MYLYDNVLSNRLSIVEMLLLLLLRSAVALWVERRTPRISSRLECTHSL